MHYACASIKTGCSAVRLAHLLWEQGVPGSNPGIPTKLEALIIKRLLMLFLLSLINSSAHLKKMKSFLKKVKGFSIKCEEKCFEKGLLKYFDKSVTMYIVTI